MKHIIARYASRCFATGQPIAPGDPILYDSRTRRAYAMQEPTISPGAALARELEPNLDAETADSVGRYMAESARRYQSHIWRAGGREYYRNKRGICEDAPCCGCCSA